MSGRVVCWRHGYDAATSARLCGPGGSSDEGGPVVRTEPPASRDCPPSEGQSPLSTSLVSGVAAPRAQWAEGCRTRRPQTALGRAGPAAVGSGSVARTGGVGLFHTPVDPGAGGAGDLEDLSRPLPSATRVARAARAGVESSTSRTAGEGTQRSRDRPLGAR